MKPKFYVAQNKGIFLNPYGGVGNVAKSFAARGVETALVDLLDDAEHNNLTLESAHNDIVAMLRHTELGIQVVICIGIELPCDSWSRARGGGGGPPMIRSLAALWGLDGIRPCDQKKVNEGNQQARWALAWITIAMELNIPGYLEHPLGSWFWHLPQIVAWINQGRAHLTHLHMCQYNRPYKKPTRLLLFGGVPAGAIRLARCRARGCLCSRTGLPHQLLKGIDPNTRKFMTKRAQIYPAEFAEDLVSQLMPHLRTR